MSVPAKLARAVALDADYDRNVIRPRPVHPVALLLAVSMGALAGVGLRADPPATRPSAPTVLTMVQRPLDELLRDLDSNDPSLQDAARSELMLLEFREIEKLKEAARSQVLSDGQVAALEEVVKQVFIANQMPRLGEGFGFMGVTMPISSDDDPDAGLPAVILGRVIGCDAYRVLRDGDTVVGMQPINQNESPMVSIGSYREMRAFLRGTKGGSWILVRVIRNGEAVETLLHLGLNTGNRDVDQPTMRYLAEEFWLKQFEPFLKRQPSTPAS